MQFRVIMVTDPQTQPQTHTQTGPITSSSSFPFITLVCSVIKKAVSQLTLMAAY